MKDRLRQFDRDAAARRVDPAGVERARSRALEGLIQQGARWVGRGEQAFLVFEEELSLPRRRDVHGDFWVRAGLQRPRGRRAWAIFDTETTGLESGTGTLVFLVGLVLWRDRASKLMQFFLPEPVAEPGFWRAVSGVLGGCGHLLSYNGAAFDLPRMRTRMRLNRVETDGLGLPHADLLPPTRRIARRWLADARLGTVESELLELRRMGDLPGSQAPEVYRAFLAGEGDVGLSEVLRHNRDDVRHLVDLTIRLSKIYGGRDWSELPATSRCDLARAVAARGDSRRALSILATVCEDGEARVRAEARALAADLHRRHGRFEAARDELLAALEDRPSALDTRVQLAKLYEHRLGALAEARASTREALRLVSRREALGDRPREGAREALVHRLRRLERKMGGCQGG